MFVEKISGWTWYVNCGLSTWPSLLMARTRIHALSQPFSVKNGVQHTIVTCGHVLLLQMCLAHSLRLGLIIKKIFLLLAEGECSYSVTLEYQSLYSYAGHCSLSHLNVIQ